MIFDFTDDQVSFASSVEALLESMDTPYLLRQAWEAPAQDDVLWRRFAEVGLLGVLVDESVGGAGGTPVDAALAMERVGYHGFAGPMADTAIVAPMVLTRCDTALGKRWLSRIANGDAVVSSVADPSGLTPYALHADAYLVVESDTVHLVPRGEADVVPVASIDPSLGFAVVKAATSPHTEVGAAEHAASTVRASSAMAAALLLVGTTQRMLDLTCRHVLSRTQFGQPIGAFQAVKHRLADVAVHLEAARGLAWFAAYAASSEPDGFGPAASQAKAAASIAAAAAGRAALQFHGGIGFTWEHDLHLYLQRAKALETLYGTAAEHRQAVGKSFLHTVRDEANQD